jgi:hypothetical protein
VLFKLIGHAGIVLSGEERIRIETCGDLATLERWLDNVLTAKTADELFRDVERQMPDGVATQCENVPPI